MATGRLDRRAAGSARGGALVLRCLATMVLVVIVLVPTTSFATAYADAPQAPGTSRDRASSVTDPRLRQQVATALGRRTEGVEPSVAVEVLTTNTEAVAATIAALGGGVTGSVPGALLQASVPAARVGELAAAAGVDHVRALGLVDHRPRAHAVTEAASGGTVNEGVAAINATAWHDAGLRGGVRVGIVDYFSTASWNEAKQGPLPTLVNGHMFCADSVGIGLCNGNGSISSAQGDRHGLAVAEVVRDVAPDAELFIATIATIADMRAAVDWFAANGVGIITRSLGSAYDGPGDGTGPLDSVVDYAAARGLVWFNSAGNDAGDGYMKVRVAATNRANAVEFAPGDDLLRLFGDPQTGCFQLDGVRWSNDWYLPPSQRTDYRVEVFEPANLGDVGSVHTNPTNLVPVDLDPFTPGVQNSLDADQRRGAPPLEMADTSWCTATHVSYLRIVRNRATPVGAVPDTIEIASSLRDLEYTSDAGGSAAKPAVDSNNDSLVAVGALATANGSTVAFYSSQGPTTDGRIKPDLVAPSCVTNTVYAPQCFSGTSAAAPAAAGVAALLLGAGLSTGGPNLAALVNHMTVDIGAPGPDNTAGRGRLRLLDPPPPHAVSAPGRYVPVTPARLLDTRPISPVGPPGLVGPHRQRTILDLGVLGAAGVPTDGVSAVAVNITSVDSTTTSFVQALPTMAATLGTTSTLNVSDVGAPRPNFAIVPLGAGGQISLYLPAGGNVLVDLLGWFAAPPAAGLTNAATAGRFVAIAPERWMDSRAPGPLPSGFAVPRRVAAGETATVPTLAGSGVPATGVAALVVNVTADDALVGSFLRAEPTGSTGLTHSSLNFLPSTPAANMAIVPLGAGGSISVYAREAVDVIVDVLGYITDDAAPASTAGLFVATTPQREYDSRVTPPAIPFAASTSRDVALVPPDAAAVSANLTVDQGPITGFVKVSPAGGPRPATSNLNFAGGHIVANAALLKLGTGGAVSVFVNQPAHVIIDVNGWFTGPG